MGRFRALHAKCESDLSIPLAISSVQFPAYLIIYWSWFCWHAIESLTFHIVNNASGDKSAIIGADLRNVPLGWDVRHQIPVRRVLYHFDPKSWLLSLRYIREVFHGLPKLNSHSTAALNQDHYGPSRRSRQVCWVILLPCHNRTGCWWIYIESAGVQLDRSISERKRPLL